MQQLANNKANTADLAKVAESGDYNDLENTPTNYVSKEELDDTEEVVAAALNDLN